MNTPRRSDLRRRDFLCFAGSAAALLALAASPFAAFAQTAPGGAPLKIGTIGSGREGGALGTLFAKAGHPVMFSSRHPEQLKDLVASADRKSTRLNSSHPSISYAVFCLKKKKKKNERTSHIKTT